MRKGVDTTGKYKIGNNEIMTNSLKILIRVFFHFWMCTQYGVCEKYKVFTKYWWDWIRLITTREDTKYPITTKRQGPIYYSPVFQPLCKEFLIFQGFNWILETTFDNTITFSICSCRNPVSERLKSLPVITELVSNRAGLNMRYV